MYLSLQQHLAGHQPNDLIGFPLQAICLVLQILDSFRGQVFPCRPTLRGTSVKESVLE